MGKFELPLEGYNKAANSLSITVMRADPGYCDESQRIYETLISLRRQRQDSALDPLDMDADQLDARFTELVLEAQHGGSQTACVDEGLRLIEKYRNKHPYEVSLFEERFTLMKHELEVYEDNEVPV